MPTYIFSFIQSLKCPNNGVRGCECFRLFLKGRADVDAHGSCMDTVRVCTENKTDARGSCMDTVRVCTENKTDAHGSCMDTVRVCTENKTDAHGSCMDTVRACTENKTDCQNHLLPFSCRPISRRPAHGTINGRSINPVSLRWTIKGEINTLFLSALDT